jgi:hypothetical protein
MNTGLELDHFMRYGVQYYGSARTAFHDRYFPVCGNIFHHAIEMLLKAELSRDHSLDQLKKRFGHDLAKLWIEFKRRFPTANLQEFDGTINLLNEFEELRYPDSQLAKGAHIVMRNEPSRAADAPTSLPAVPTYELTLTAIDNLVGRILQVMLRDPKRYFSVTTEDGLRRLVKGNPACGDWF